MTRRAPAKQAQRASTAPADPILRPALLTMNFVAAGPEAGPTGRERLDELWSACAALGMSEPVAGLPTSPELPAVPQYAASLTILAACARPDPKAVYQAFAFAEHDVAGLVALMAPNTDEGGLGAWRRLAREWEDATQPSSASAVPRATGVLGETRVFEALVPEASTAAAERLRPLLSHAVPDAPARTWDSHDQVRPGFLVWQNPELGGQRTRRTLYVVASEQAEGDLDDWAWARDGHFGLMPLARYMLQTWRIEHQRRLLHTSPPIEKLVRDSDEQAEALLGEIIPDPARPALGLASLLRAQELLDRTRLGPQGLAWTTTRLAQLARTVKAAADNAQLYSPRCRHRGPGESFVQADRSDAELVIRQVESSLVHLEAAGTRAVAARELAGAGVENALRERRDRITIIQGSFIGAVLMALTAIQAFAYRVPLAPVLVVPTIVLAATVALALPIVAFRVARLIPERDPYWWVDSVAATALAAATTWNAVTWPDWQLRHRIASLGVTAPAVGAVAVLAGGWALARHRSRTRPENGGLVRGKLGRPR